MIREDKENVPTDPDLWDDMQKVVQGKKAKVTRTVDGEEVTVEAPNDGDGYEVHPSAYCVTEDAEALTPSGWVGRDDLSVGDLVYTYDRVSGGLTVSPVRAIHAFEDQPVYRFEADGINFSMRCTDGHRMVRVMSDDWTEAAEDTQRRLKVAEGDTTYAEARDAGVPFTQEFASSYGGMEVEAALDARKNRFSQMRTVRSIVETGATWNVLVSAAHDTDHRSRERTTYVKCDTDIVKRVLAMSYAERLAFLEASVMCDGSQLNASDTCVSYAFTQKNRDHLEAVRLAAFLTGHMVTESAESNGCVTLCIKTRRHIGNRSMSLSRDGTEDVWCPETDQGTWVVKQGGTVTITGNSNSWAAKMYKKLGGGWKKGEKNESAYKRAVFESSYAPDIWEMVLAEKGYGGLDDWHDEDWVDISRTDDDGNHPPCGDSAGEGKREEDPEYAAPKCVPKSKAKSMSKKEKERLVRRKRDAEREDDNDSSSEDGTSDSPTMTSSDPDDQRKKDESIVREIVRAQIRSLFRNGQ